jgi:hypothetical protein
MSVSLLGSVGGSPKGKKGSDNLFRLVFLLLFS